jgi:hypothetical protein
LRRLARPNLGRNPDRNRIGWHVTNNHRISAYRNVIPNPDAPQDLRSGADIRAIADNRRSALTRVTKPHGDSISDHAIIPEYRVSTYDNAAKVINAKAPAKLRFTRKFDARKDLHQQLKHFVRERKWKPKRPTPNPVTPITEPVDDHDPETLTSPLAIVGAPILADVLEHEIAPWPRLKSYKYCGNMAIGSILPEVFHLSIQALISRCFPLDSTMPYFCSL